MESSHPATVDRAARFAAPELESLSRDRVWIEKERRRAAWRGALAGAIPMALSILVLFTWAPVALPSVLRSLGHLLPEVLALPLQVGVMLTWFLAPAAASLALAPWTRGRVRELSERNPDLGEAAAAGVCMGACAAVAAGALRLMIEGPLGLPLVPAVLASALGAGTLSVATFRAVPGREGGKRGSLPPIPSLLVGAGLAAPVLSLAFLAGAVFLGSFPSLAQLLQLPFEALPYQVRALAAVTAMMACLAPASVLASRRIRRLLPEVNRTALCLGIAALPLLPLLGTTRHLFRDTWWAPLAPLFIAGAGLVTLGTHATAALIGSREDRADRPASLPGSGIRVGPRRCGKWGDLD